MEDNECVRCAQSWLGVPHAYVEDCAASAQAGNVRYVLKLMKEHQKQVLEDM